MKIINELIAILFLSLVFFSSCSIPKMSYAETQDIFPWCIVAYDSLERSPSERISMMKKIGFKKYAYDWRDRHLDSASKELKLAVENDIEIISVWLWLNAKRDSLDNLSPSNERLFKIVEELDLKTTFWVSLSGNFFEHLDQNESLDKAIEIIQSIAVRANELGCKVALYNHSGWFGNPSNQLKIIKAISDIEISIVYNFHHGHNSIDEFPDLIETIKPYLSAVNLNGMQKDGEKILTIGKGNHEKEMIKTLKDAGFNGPWGILGHVEGADVQKIIEQNIQGLKDIGFK